MTTGPTPWTRLIDVGRSRKLRQRRCSSVVGRQWPGNLSAVDTFSPPGPVAASRSTVERIVPTREPRGQLEGFGVGRFLSLPLPRRHASVTVHHPERGFSSL